MKWNWIDQSLREITILTWFYTFLLDFTNGVLKLQKTSVQKCVCCLLFSLFFFFLFPFLFTSFLLHFLLLMSDLHPCLGYTRRLRFKCTISNFESHLRSRQYEGMKVMFVAICCMYMARVVFSKLHSMTPALLRGFLFQLGVTAVGICFYFFQLSFSSKINRWTKIVDGTKSAYFLN